MIDNDLCHTQLCKKKKKKPLMNICFKKALLQCKLNNKHSFVTVRLYKKRKHLHVFLF